MSEVSPTRSLIALVRPFAKESIAKSWFHVASTLAIMVGLFSLTLVGPIWFRVAIGLLAGLTVIRTFILYHDHLHGALLKNSWLMKSLMAVFSVLVMTPRRHWQDAHNRHHANNSRIAGANTDSYMVLTTHEWAAMPLWKRVAYRLSRHPVTFLLAFFTVFMFGQLIHSIVNNPLRYWDSLVVFCLHAGLTVGVIVCLGWTTYALTIFVPLASSMMLGSYLFFAQHNFPEAYIQPSGSWEFTRAALDSSSYLQTGPFWSWVTGNIGYHHVHHLHPMIPFYRLPEAMRAVPELQNPRGRTSLHPRDIVACFRQNLRDPDQECMVGYPRSQASRKAMVVAGNNG